MSNNKKTRSRSHQKTRSRSHQKNEEVITKNTLYARKVPPYDSWFNVYYLLLNNYKFNESYPLDIVEEIDPRNKLLGKIWFIKEKVRQKTYFNTPIELIKNYYIHPDGFCAFPPLYKKFEYNKVYNELISLFKQSNKGSKDEKINVVYSKKHDQYFTSLNCDESVLTDNYNCVINYLEKRKYTSLIDMINKYLKQICKMYEITCSNKFINEYMEIILLQYANNSGMSLHLDNIKKRDQGPIITVSIGHPFVIYDMTPVILDNKLAKPLRFIAKEGSIFVMDGSSRMEWAHGLPFNVPSNDGKLKHTIIFKFHKFKELNPIYNKELDYNITLSGKIC